MALLTLCCLPAASSLSCNKICLHIACPEPSLHACALKARTPLFPEVSRRKRNFLLHCIAKPVTLQAASSLTALPCRSAVGDHRAMAATCSSQGSSTAKDSSLNKDAMLGRQSINWSACAARATVLVLLLLTHRYLPLQYLDYGANGGARCLSVCLPSAGLRGPRRQIDSFSSPAGALVNPSHPPW